MLFVVEYFYKEEGYSYLTVFSILVIILFVVFTHEVGYDYLNYISYFNVNANISSSKLQPLPAISARKSQRCRIIIAFFVVPHLAVLSALRANLR